MSKKGSLSPGGPLAPDGLWERDSHYLPLGNPKPMATQMSFIKLGGSQNTIKHHVKRDLHPGMVGRGVDGV